MEGSEFGELSVPGVVWVELGQEFEQDIFLVDALRCSEDDLGFRVGFGARGRDSLRGLELEGTEITLDDRGLLVEGDPEEPVLLVGVEDECLREGVDSGVSGSVDDSGDSLFESPALDLALSVGFLGE